MLPKKGGVMSPTDEKFLARLKARYRSASKKERSKILDEYVSTTGQHRKYATGLLGGSRHHVNGPIRRPRRAKYGAEEVQALLTLWDLFDGICSKRLRAALHIELPRLRAAGCLDVSDACYEKLLQISPASIDRLLVGQRLPATRSRGFTKPGTLLKQQIPIRTWAEWSENKPGFCEMDLVDHCGGVVIRGADHAWTLCFTDVCTGWTECMAVRNKAQVHVFGAIRGVRERLPFALLGVDSDNGTEFINDQLLRYCRKEEITFTRGRAGKKNDNAYVEQKNWSVVRRATGYHRYDTAEQLDLLNRLYAVMHFYINFFIPVAKLREKTREGSKVKKVYDEPKTPYARVLASTDVSEEHKAQLRETYALLDLVYLRRQIDALQDKLLDSLSQC
jgi:hypothetical protein